MKQGHKVHLLLILIVIVGMTSCSVHKRLYRRGYTIFWNQNYKKDAEKNNNRIIPQTESSKLTFKNFKHNLTYRFNTNKSNKIKKSNSSRVVHKIKESDNHFLLKDYQPDIKSLTKTTTIPKSDNNKSMDWKALLLALSGIISSILGLNYFYLTSTYPYFYIVIGLLLIGSFLALILSNKFWHKDSKSFSKVVVRILQIVGWIILSFLFFTIIIIGLLYL